MIPGSNQQYNDAIRILKHHGYIISTGITTVNDILYLTVPASPILASDIVERITDIIPDSFLVDANTNHQEIIIRYDPFKAAIKRIFKKIEYHCAIASLALELKYLQNELRIV